jgi:hypothetical protein
MRQHGQNGSPILGTLETQWARLERQHPVRRRRRGRHGPGEAEMVGGPDPQPPAKGRVLDCTQAMARICVAIAN